MIVRGSHQSLHSFNSKDLIMNSSKKVQSFLYRPLQHEDSFRLLKLRRTSSSDTWEGNVVEQHLPSHHCAADAPKYVALSYVWGDPTFNVPNEDSMELSFSVSNALGHILDAEAEADQLSLWVDQFCINQRDEEEKKHQVSMMGRIYARAEKVIGWLGPAFEGSEQALDDLIMFAGAHDEAPEEQEKWLEILRSRLGPYPEDPVQDFISYLGQVVHLGSDVRARMKYFFNLPWFRRRWIAQEACLASDLRVYCGYRSISGGQLLRAISAIESIVVYGVSPWIQRPFRNAFALLQTRDAVQQATRGEYHLSFLHIVHNLSFLDCTEDQDRINALYGIVPSTTSWFHPEYCNTPQLYVDFAIAHMHHYGSLDILHFAGVTDPARHVLESLGDSPYLEIACPHQDLPSWVPDWRVRYRQLPMLPATRDVTDQGKSPSPFEATYDPTDNTLTLRAKLLDPAITPCGIPHLDRSVTRESPQHQHSIDPWCNALFANYLKQADAPLAELYGHSPSFIYWSKSALEADRIPCNLLLRFARTLIMDGKIRSNERPDCVVPQENILEYFLEYAKLSLVDDLVAARAIFEALMDDKASREKATAYGYLAEHVCRYRTLFVGDDELIGLGSIGICPGDRICFFRGLTTPFVLHPKGGHFELRGECYLDGFMDIPFDRLEAVEREIVLE